ncbi:unnamed protein product, partial [Ectocarpus sp. 12 AP-2014]
LKTVAGTKIAPDGISAWNPAFDVTPARLITAIVTDKGCVPRKEATEDKEFDVKAFCEAMSAGEGQPDQPPPVPEASAPSASLETPEGYRALTGEGAIAQYLAGLPKVMALIGASSAADVVSEEFGDGNLNLVFRCRGPAGDAGGTVIVKQALPYVRCVGEPPHIILRLGLIRGLRYSTLAVDMGTYLARTLFFSSALHLTGSQMKEEIGRWASNWPMCELTEQV